MVKYVRWLQPEGLAQIAGWVCGALSDGEIAEKMQVTPHTLRRWMARYPPLQAALHGQHDAVQPSPDGTPPGDQDDAVEDALHKRAIGFYYEEERVERNGKEGEKTTVTRKYMPPDLHAAIFWLKNRRPDQWREKQEPLAPAEQRFQVEITIV